MTFVLIPMITVSRRNPVNPVKPKVADRTRVNQVLADRCDLTQCKFAGEMRPNLRLLLGLYADKFPCGPSKRHGYEIPVISIDQKK